MDKYQEFLHEKVVKIKASGFDVSLDEHDDFQVCESCYRKYQAAQQTLAPDAVPAERKGKQYAL